MSYGSTTNEKVMRDRIAELEQKVEHERNNADNLQEEVDDLKRQLKATIWQKITPENLPKEDDRRPYLVSDGKDFHFAYRGRSVNYFWDCDTYGLKQEEATYFMLINPPAPSKEQP